MDTALEQFGATVGGDIKKDKLFYFLSYEDQRYIVGNPAAHNIPVSGSLSSVVPGGDPAHSLVDACIAAQALGPVAALSAQIAGLSPTTCQPVSGQPAGGFQGLFPLNNGPGVTEATDIDSHNQVDGGLVKIDYHLSDKHSINGFYFNGLGNGLLVDNPPMQVVPTSLTIQNAKTQVGAGNWTWTPSSNWVNEARVGYSRYYQAFLSNDYTDNPASYTFNGSTYHIYTGQTNSAYFGLPEITFQSFGTFLLGAGWPKYVGPDSTTQILDHVSYLHGSHAFKFGGEVLLMKNPSNVSANAKGPLKFPNLTQFFQGIPSSANFLSGDLQRTISSQGVCRLRARRLARHSADHREPGTPLRTGSPSQPRPTIYWAISIRTPPQGSYKMATESIVRTPAIIMISRRALESPGTSLEMGRPCSVPARTSCTSSSATMCLITWPTSWGCVPFPPA